MLEEFSAGAVIFYREKQDWLFLVLHYEEGHWGAPKGHIEKGESEEQTALREIREETGLSSVRLIPGFKAESRYTYSKNGQPSNKSVSFFIAESPVLDIELSDEHLEYSWLPFDIAAACITYPGEKQVWHSAHAFLNENKSI